MTRETNRRLLRNLTILQGLMGPEKAKTAIHQAELLRRGFDLGACTRARLEKGNIVFECYHFSYKIRKDGVVVIEQHLEISEYLPGFFRRWMREFPEGMEIGHSGKGTIRKYHKRE